MHRWILQGDSHVELSILQVWTLILQVEFVISQLGGDSTTWRWFATWFIAWRWFCKVVHSCEDGVSTCEVAHVCLEVVSQLWNTLRNFTSGFHFAAHFVAAKFRTAWCSCLQTAITSLFQLQFTNRLKRWTPNFLSFEMKYSMHKMDSRKYSKYVQKFLSSWISSC